MPPRRKIELLSKTIEKLLAARGLAGRMKEYRVFSLWEQAVGAVIARHAQPSAIRAGKLTVIVDSSAWMQQLSLLRPELTDKLNRMLGETAVEQISLRVGEIVRTGPVERPALRPAAGLTAEDRELIEHAVSGIPDGEVRESLRHLMEKDLLARHTNRRF
jgi:hypothetical protein